MKKENKINFIMSIVGLLGLGYFFNSLIPFRDLEYLLKSKRFLFLIIFLISTLIIMIWGAMLGRKENWEKDLLSFLDRIPIVIRKIISAVLLVLPTILFLFLRFPNANFSASVRIVFSLSCILWSVLLNAQKRSTFERFKLIIISSIIVGTLFSLAQLFNQVSTYPFSLGWSEGNRQWDYSILFGSDRYVIQEGQVLIPFLDRGRAYLWGLIYLVPNIGIWGVRFFDALIKSIPYMVLGFVLIWPDRKKISKNGILVFVFWAFLFIRQGPIHSPLIVSAILTVIAVNIKNLGISSLLVIAAAYYATITRFNWVFASGLWAGMLSLNLIPKLSFSKENLKKLIKPLILGLSGYFGGQILPNIKQYIGKPTTSANLIFVPNIESYRAFQQEFLWDRLWPNQTYGPGIVASLLFAAIPTIILLVWFYRTKKWEINWMQLLGTLIPGISFLAVGLVASVKIGGGGDLHNMDMFLIFLLLIIGSNWKAIWNYFFDSKNITPFLLIIITMMIFPVIFSFSGGSPLDLPPKDKTLDVVNIIQEQVDLAQLGGGAVLFMDQRQLVTFNSIENVIMINDYEKKMLIDDSFIRSTHQLDAFYKDLESQRFSLILSNEIKLNLQSDNPFSEENNYWVVYVSSPILEFYEPLFTFGEYDIQLLVPKGN